MTTFRKSKKSTSSKKDYTPKTNTEKLYEGKAGEIIKAMEDRMCEGTFRLRWDARPSNYLSKRPYTNMNLLLIAFSEMISENPFQSRYWLTLKQANKLGYRINKGATATYIVGWFKSQYEVEETDEHGVKQTVKKQGRLSCKPFAIYNLEQTNAPVETEESVKKSASFEENLAILKKMLSDTDVEFLQGGDRAYYSPLHHSIKMPFFQHFVGDTQEIREQLYLTTVAHELAHSTMKVLRPEHYHPFVNQNVFEPASEFLYAKEEVVAEITAAMLCATLGIEKQVLPDHFAYVRGWLNKAKEESPLYFSTACRLATQAHDFLMSKVDSSFTYNESDYSDFNENVAESA